VQLILHLGAKKRPEVASPEIADPASLLQGLGPERASVKFRDLGHIDEMRADFVELVRQWLGRLA
jgi:hypothetical protein